MSRLLLIEDDKMTAATVVDFLTSRNHVVDHADTGPLGLEHLLGQPYELAIVDWGLPGMKGIDVCRTYRKSGGQTPILFLTAESKLENKIEAYESLCDDYLCKPFSPEELLARVDALLRRPKEEPHQILQSGDLTLDMVSCDVKVGAQTIKLTAGEFKLLRLFLQNPRQVLSVPTIMEKLFESELESTEHATRQLILCLRKKIAIGGHDESIVTVTGSGYRFDPHE